MKLHLYKAYKEGDSCDVIYKKDSKENYCN